MSGSLRILAVHRYYWPDTPPYASMLRRITHRWYEDGHEVEVLTSQPSYKAGLDNPYCPRQETLDGVKIERLRLPSESRRPMVRIWNAFRLGGGVLWRVLRRRYDVIMISTAPPILGGFFAALASRLTGARFIYHCMDIHPEVGRVSGEFRQPLVFNLLTKLDNWSCQRADPIVVLSQDMANTLRKRSGGDHLAIKILNNFSLPADRELPKELPFEWSNDRLVVLFAGNVGRFQGLGVVVDAMACLNERDDIEFVVMGEGVAKEELQNKAEALGAHVRFVGHQSVEVAKAAMKRADAGFVSLSEGMYHYAYPSKTMTYLEQECPVIVAVEPESELARDVVEGGYGYHVAPGDTEGLIKLLQTLANDRSSISQMQARAKQRFAEQFSEEVVLNEWAQLLKNRTLG